MNPPSKESISSVTRSVPIWVTTHGFNPTGHQYVKSKPALLKWNIRDATFSITLVDENDTPQVTIIAINIQAMTKLLISTVNYVVKVNDAFYIIQPRNTSEVTIQSALRFSSSPILSSATTESNLQLQQFGQDVRSLIPERVSGGKFSVKARLKVGLVLGVFIVIGIVIYSLTKR